MKRQRLNARGFSHDLLLVAFVVVFALVGAAYLVELMRQHVATPSREYQVPPLEALASRLAVHVQSSLAQSPAQPLARFPFLLRRHLVIT